MLGQPAETKIAYNLLLALCLWVLIFGGVFKAFFVLIDVYVYDLTILSAVFIVILLCIKPKFKFKSL